MKQTKLRRSQFTFYASYFNAIEHLPKTRRYEALRAVIRYALEGELPEDLSPAASGVFDAIRPNLDSGRTKAAARLKELAEAAGEPDFDSPSGNNKNKREKKKENKTKNKNEYKNESKNEYKNENENQNEAAEKNEAAPAGVRDAGAAQSAEGVKGVGAAQSAAGVRDAGAVVCAEGEDELIRLGRRDRKLSSLLDQLIRHWQNEGSPLTPLERKRMALALAVHTPDEQIDAVCSALFQNRRQLTFSSTAFS